MQRWVLPVQVQRVQLHAVPGVHPVQGGPVPGGRVIDQGRDVQAVTVLVFKIKFPGQKPAIRSESVYAL